MERDVPRRPGLSAARRIRRSRCCRSSRRGRELHPGRWRFVLRDRLADRRPGRGPGRGSAARAHRRRVRRSAPSSLRATATEASGRVDPWTTTGPQTRRSSHRRGPKPRSDCWSATRQIAGSAIRRKVLALLCFLLTKPDMSSTRDQVLDALWPELDPLDALELPQPDRLLPATGPRGALRRRPVAWLPASRLGSDLARLGARDEPEQ